MNVGFSKKLLEGSLEVILEVGAAAAARVEVERRNNFNSVANYQ